jgi:hypothetical protein
MSKEYVVYGLVGIVLGLVFGFVVANWTAGAGPVNQTAKNADSGATSVNSSSGAPELPPNHPPLNSAQPIPAPPLAGPGGSSGAGLSAGSAAASAGSEILPLPSLDPLPASSREERAEQKYKNIQMFKGLPSDRLLNIMLAFRSSLGVDCTYCHVKDQWEKDDKPAKQTARKMISMVRDINNRFGAASGVSCYTCHRGQTRPAKQ